MVQTAFAQDAHVAIIRLDYCPETAATQSDLAVFFQSTATFYNLKKGAVCR